MAAGGDEGIVDLTRFHQGKYVDALRWLPPVVAFDRLVATANFDRDKWKSSIEIHSLITANPSSEEAEEENNAFSLKLQPESSRTSPARVSSLKVASTSSKILIAAASATGHAIFLLADPLELSLQSLHSVGGDALHRGEISGFDLHPSTCECLTAASDGRINVVRVSEGLLQPRRVFDSKGIVSYTAARWTSPSEFVTASPGFSLQLWDQRRHGAAVFQSPSNWIAGSTVGFIHSIDVHSSRKHICVAGGSSGTVFAWDLRWHKEPISLTGFGLDDRQGSSVLSESDIWEVQYDNFVLSGSLSASSSKILPVVMCSEDGILGVLEQGEAPLEVLAEPCAINTFDIDPENPSDIMCAAEWETIIFLRRSTKS